MVHRLTLAYHGGRYAGWQRQTNASTVQEIVEHALAGLFDTPVRIHAASRTDAGVHAEGQIVHLDLPRTMPLEGLVHGCNHRLPPDVRVTAAHRMADGFDARRSVLGKAYRYRLFHGRVVPPLLADRAVGAPADCDLPAIRRAIGAFVGEHDFGAFALAGGSHTTSVRRLFAASVERQGRQTYLRFFGAGFLRGMVRGMVGTLLEVGSGRREADSIASLLDGGPRSRSGPTAPAHGLTLERVFYPPAWRPLASYRP